MRESIKLNWPTLLFLVISPVVALGGFIWWIAGGHFSWLTVLLTAILALATGLGITAGYHRLYSHKSFESPWPIRLLLLFFGGACFEGSAWEWCIDHRRHHRHVDSEADPYSIKKGFWHAHILWLFFREPGKLAKESAPDLWKDPLVRFQQRFYLPLAILGSFIFPWCLAGFCWGDPIGGLFVAGAVRLVVNQHFTFAINSVCHKFGKQTYSKKHSARDNWITALFTYGEGYHNFHHEFPSDYRNGIRFYQWDPTKWLIRSLAWLGLARDLKVVGMETIMLKKLSLKEEQIKKELTNRPNTIVDFANHLLQSTRLQVQQAAERLKDLRKQFHALKKRERSAVIDKYKLLKIQLRQAETEFRHTVALWEATARRLRKLIDVSQGLSGSVS